MHGRHGQAGEAAAPQADVEGLFERLGIRPYKNWEKWLHILPGWFAETIPFTIPAIGSIALLHLDGDWHESTKVCMEHLYPLVASGGVVYADDLGYWCGAKRAVAECFVNRGEQMPAVRWVDHTGAFWTKP